MKLILFLMIIVFGLTNIKAQEDTSGIKDKEMKIKVQIQNQEGIKKNKGSKDNPDVNKKIKGKDVFIDKDGDGICDTRQGGMSFNKLRKRYGKQNNGSGPGGKRNGGNNNGGGR